MTTPASQIQLKLSLSEELNRLLQTKAARLGVPVTLFVKHLILKEVEKEAYPIYQASQWLEERSKKALEDIDNAVEVENVHEFFKKL